VIGDSTELAEWDAFRTTSGWDGQAAIHVDTGMNRLGFRVQEAQALLPRIRNGNHGISLVMRSSHQC
jgi:alanine racemase